MATVGPASRAPKTLQRMIRAGMDIARLNMSHGDHEQHAENIRRIRQAEKTTSRPVAIHVDLGGPKIRVGKLPQGLPIDLKPKSTVIFAPETTAKAGEIPVTFPNLAGDLTAGDTMLIDDGLLSVRVTKISEKRIAATVVDGGPLREHKGINLPGVALATSAITKKDEQDLRFALRHGVDFVGVSFAQRPEDIQKVRRIMRREKRIVPIIAKIERQTAIDHFEAIMREADAVMVARGDLGVEIPLERVPIIQKQILTEAEGLRKPSIVATQMLESMVHEARPTRAEASDAANAVFDGADCVMLSAETSVGRDPVLAVATLARIVAAAEESPYLHLGTFEPDVSYECPAIATARAACFAAEDANAQALLVFTITGRSAVLLAKQRPSVEIIALTHDADAARRTCLLWGTTPLHLRTWKSIDTMIAKGVDAALCAKRIRRGQKAVIVCGSDTAPGAANMMKVMEV